MEARDTCAADLVDTVHREMDSAVHNHRFYKSVQLRVIGKQVLLEKKPLANPHDEFAVCGSGKRFSDSWLHSVEVIFANHMVLYYMKGSIVCCQASVILLGEGGKEKAQQDQELTIYIMNSWQDH